MIIWDWFTCLVFSLFVREGIRQMSLAHFQTGSAALSIASFTALWTIVCVLERRRK